MKESLRIRILTEIIKGSSEFTSDILGKCEVRHSDLYDEVRFKGLYEDAFDLAIKKKIPTEEEAVEILDKKGLWTKADETEVVRLRSMIASAQASMERVIPEQRVHLEGDLNDMFAKLQDLINRKDQHKMNTAEEFASKMSFEAYIPLLFNSPPYSSEDVDYMDDRTMHELVRIFTIIQNRIGPAGIKQAAITPHAQNMVALSEDPMVIFGKPLVDLTTPQSQLIVCAKNYKILIGELRGKVSDESLDDPDALDKWAEADERGRDRLERDMGAKADKFSSYDAIKAAAGASENPNDRAASLKAVKGLL